MIKIIYFVHGTTVDNEAKNASGWNDAPLSEKGIEQSKNVRNLININEIDCVFSSDLSRAYDSARNIFGDDKTILQDAKIRECNYGIYNGKNKENVVYEDHIDVPFEEGESLQDVEKRVRKFLKYLLEFYDGKTIALVSHRAPQLAIEKIIYNKTWEEVIKSDWRKTKDWKPGWKYEINNIE